ncbi:MAG: hypothetical protein E3J70_03875 [Candidatus Heimdallarchaeota archaeon]|nr:MAG: hypothetical protein E3J70_03875 [Candidatus Heimdallarchaeota archaeon]
MGLMFKNKSSFFNMSSLFVIIILVCNFVDSNSTNNNYNDDLEPSNLVNSYFPNLFAINSNIMFEINYSNILFIKDVTNPYEPILISTYSLQTGGTILSVEVSEDLVFLIRHFRNGMGIEIVDISSLDNPTYKGSYSTYDMELYSYHFPTEERNSFYVNDNLIYCMGRDEGLAILKILDYTNFSNIIEIGEYSTNFHGHWGFELFTQFISDEILIIKKNDGILHYVNITDESQPKFLGEYTIASEYRRYFFMVTIHGNELFSFKENSLCVFNLDNLTNPVFDRKITLNNETDVWVIDTAFDQNCLFAVSHQELEVFDLEDKTSNSSLSRYVCIDKGYHMFFWGVIGDNRIYMGRETEFEGRTLFIIDYTNLFNLVHIYPDPEDARTHQGWSPQVPLVVPYSSIIILILIVYTFKKWNSKKKNRLLHLS